MSIELYVYYQAAVDDAGEICDRVSTMQAALTSACQIQASLKRRPQAQDGKHTWMEIYRDTPPNFVAVLEQAAADAGLLRLIDGPRRVEIFIDIEPCA